MFLSVVIPTWCEAPLIGETVAAVRPVADEVIVADPDSPDGTAEVAERAGARVVRCRRGRGPQLAAGAATARGDVLLFLHADTELPPQARAVITAAMDRAEIVGGNFRLRFVPETGWAKLFGWVNHHRRRLLRIYYGDSAIFVRRSIYQRIGGFRDLPILEDYEFVQRLEACGPTAYLTDACVQTSARRFRHAPLRTLLVWGVIQGLYSAGMRPERLSRLYRDIR